jgi:hypothetical protein
MRRPWILLLVLLSGCAETALKKSTLDTAATVRDVNYQQVLNNLAMYVDDPYTLPSQVKLTGGLIQISDTAGPTYDFSMPNNMKVTQDIKMSLNRQWTEKWDVSPVVDPNDMRQLRQVYQWAVAGKTKDPKFTKFMAPPPGTYTAEPSSRPADRTTLSTHLQPNIYDSDIPERNFLSVSWTGSPPNDAVYVAKYRDVWVWIMPDQRENFAKFVLLTLLKAPVQPDERGPQIPALNP